MKNKLKIEFSKLIMVFAAVVNVGVIVFACVAMWQTGDLSALCYLIPSVAAEVATATGFYYSKAKVENRIKLMSAYGVEMSEQSFSENF